MSNQIWSNNKTGLCMEGKADLRNRFFSKKVGWITPGNVLCGLYLGLKRSDLPHSLV